MAEEMVIHFFHNLKLLFMSKPKNLMKKRDLTTVNQWKLKFKTNPITDKNELKLRRGVVIDKLSIKSFTDTATLRKFGSDLIQKTTESKEQPFKGEVVQGVIEQSNVNIVKEMVNMITVTRAYEANQKVLQAQDGTLEKVVNEVGAVR